MLGEIGNTPLVELASFDESVLYAKLEHQNPSGSIKDRIAYRMILDARDSGELKRGMGIIEVSSGNTGIALAMVGRELGCPVTIITGAGVTDGAKRRIRGYGGKVIEVDGYFSNCYKKVDHLMSAKPNFYYCPRQERNPVALKSNEDLGYEIADQVDVDVFLASMGTGSTISGVGKALKQRNPHTQVHLVLPDGEYHFHGVDDPNETTVSLPNFNKDVVDHEIRIKEEAAIEAARRLHEEYGHTVGVSSGAVFAASERIATQQIGNILIIFPDNGDRYTDILGGDI